MNEDLSGYSMMELFRIEAESQTALLSSGLLALEGSGRSPELIEPLMRAAHSLKGAARIVGLDAAVRVAHALEDCFAAAQSGKIEIRPEHVDVLLRGVDFLIRISQVPEGQSAQWLAEHDEAIEAVVADLGAVTSGSLPLATRPPAAPGSPEPGPSSTPAAADPDAIAPGREDAAPPPGEPSGPSAPPIDGPPQPDRVVRVAAESLTRLLGLAGESLVQTKQLRPFVDSLVRLKQREGHLLESLQTLVDRCPDGAAKDATAWRELLAEVKGQAVDCLETLNTKIEELEDFSRRNEDLTDRLHHEVLTSRMRPLADGIRGFPRLVRDLSRTLGKQVRFEVRGETTGVDRDILEKLEAPLNHLIRNALDHAIEPPEEREAAGKDPTGTIGLEARHRAGMLQVTLFDDGRGIDLPPLRAKIVELGLAGAPMAEQLSEAELLEFLFLPGFSTKHAVTEISGRGVGLDVVQSMMRAVGGTVRVSTQAGKGTRFSLQLPITRSVIRALLVRIASEPYAFPLNRIDRILVLRKDHLQKLEGRMHFDMDGQPVGLVEAAQVLGLTSTGAQLDELCVVVASDRSHRFGLIVDGFLGERDLEVRPLDVRLGKVPDINSASVLEDGSPVLIFDVEDLVRSIDNLLSGRRLKGVSGLAGGQRPRATKRVLVVDDSLTVRELERQLLENRGYAVDIAVDGVYGWNAVRGGDYQLVISDVDMPRMDGIQLVRSIKGDPRLKALPVVIVSYKDREEDRLRGLDAGADFYLTKSSFHDQTFLTTVADLIGEAAE